MITEQLIHCPGCKLILPATGALPDVRFYASGECWALYEELSAYTQSLMDPSFPHQYAADAYAAQHAGQGVKPVNTTFALVGLYFAVENGFTGRQVQRVHMLLGQRKRKWPQFKPPINRGHMTVLDVVHAEPGERRMTALKEWTRDVWAAWADEHERVAKFAQEVP